VGLPRGRPRGICLKRVRVSLLREVPPSQPTDTLSLAPRPPRGRSLAGPPSFLAQGRLRHWRIGFVTPSSSVGRCLVPKRKPTCCCRARCPAKGRPAGALAAAGSSPRLAALVADDAAGEAHQDRCEGRGAFPVRGLSDGGGRRAQATVPGDPGTDSTVVPPGHWSGAFGMIGGGVHLH